MDTIVALATPRGTSAIAVVRCSGSLSPKIFSDVFRVERTVHNHFYHFRYFSVSGELIDDVMSVFFENGHSYTGENSFEIYCHGNMLIVDKILADLCARGCRIAEGGEYTKRAFLNGRIDLSQAEAVADIIHAKNMRAVAIAQKQLSGSLGEKVNEISKKLLEVLSKIEFVIDFSDDELSSNNGESFEIVNYLDCIIADLESLISSNKFHKVVESGLDMVIIGAPNAGKSSMLNFLLGEDRAIVSELAGTTRDIISENVKIGGEYVRIYDTAGLRDGELCEVEKIGIDKALAKAEQADLFLVMIDSHSDFLPEFSEKILKKIHKDNAIIVVNKIDLAPRCDAKTFLPDVEHVFVSIENGENLDLLKEKIGNIISKSYAACDGLDIMVNRRHVDILRRAFDFLCSAKNAFIKNISAEFIASDIRQALDILGDITGKYDNEAVLDRVFANFCVGK